MINGGFIRGNRVYEKGFAFTLGDVEREFPFPKRPVLIEIIGTLFAHGTKAWLVNCSDAGKDIWEALEAGVRSVEERAGFFLHLSRGGNPFSRLF